MKRDDLALIEYTREPITPLPWAYESNSDAAWSLWDATKRMRDVIATHNLEELTK